MFRFLVIYFGIFVGVFILLHAIAFMLTVYLPGRPIHIARALAMLPTSAGAAFLAARYAGQLAFPDLPSAIRRKLGVPRTKMYVVVAVAVLLAVALDRGTAVLVLGMDKVDLRPLGFATKLGLYGLVIYQVTRRLWAAGVSVDTLEGEGFSTPPPPHLMGEISPDREAARSALAAKPAPTCDVFLIPESMAIMPGGPPQAVVDFVNAMHQKGLYPSDAMPRKFFQAFHVDYYLAQVLNGGHSQFIRNAGPLRDRIFEDVDAGLKEAGAWEFHAVFNDMLKWVQSNPEEADQQTGFTGGRAADLDILDSRLFDLEGTQRSGYGPVVSPLMEKLGAWILSWTETQRVPNSEFGDRMQAIFEANPAYQASLVEAPRREALARLRSMRSMFDRREFFIVASAYARAPSPLALWDLSPSEFPRRLNGRQVMCWIARTNEGPGDVRIGNGKVHIHERIVGGDGTRSFLESDVLDLDLGPELCVFDEKPFDQAWQAARRLDAVTVLFMVQEMFPMNSFGIMPLGFEYGSNKTALRFAIMILEGREQSVYAVTVSSEGGVLASLETNDLLGFVPRSDVDAFLKTLD